MADTTSITLMVDSELARQARELFSELGLDFSTACTMFLEEAVRTRSMPFDVETGTPNEETLEAIRDTMEERNLSRRFSDLDELMRELES